LTFPKKFFEHLENHNYTQIKGGQVRETFLEIWVVKVDNRVFARSWNKSKRSWFTAFIDTGVGQFKFGEELMNVTGKKVSSEDVIHKQINEAYQARYTEKENIFYVNGICKPEYFEYTMEFFNS